MKKLLEGSIMKIWKALYNDMVYESAAETISLHRTKKGAEMAIKKHKYNNKLDHIERFNIESEKGYGYKTQAGFTDNEIKEYDKNELEDWPKSWQWWGVKEVKVEE
jgi:hypothetical protein